jgi:hypothetical protein
MTAPQRITADRIISDARKKHGINIYSSWIKAFAKEKDDVIVCLTRKNLYALIRYALHTEQAASFQKKPVEQKKAKNSIYKPTKRERVFQSNILASQDDSFDLSDDLEETY